MKNLLIRFALWLLRRFGYSWGIPNALIAAAQELCEAQSARPDPTASGESKRHQVYARLIKDFPQVRKSDLGLAIELAVRRIR